MNVNKMAVSGVGMLFGIALTISHGKDFINAIKDNTNEKEDIKKPKKKNKKRKY